MCCSIGLPCWKRYWMPIRTFWEMLCDSCWAMLAMIVMRSSPFASIVLIFSFSNRIGMPRAFSFLMYCRQSSVFLAKRLIDLVMTMSILSASQSLIIFLNCSLFFVPVPEMPSSA